MTELEARKQILQTALQLIAQKGFVQFTMNDVVRASGMSKGGVYWHFKSKEDIIEGIFDDFIEQYSQSVQTQFASDLSAGEKLRHIFLAANLAAEADLPLSLDFYAVAVRQETLRRKLQVFFQTYQQQVASVIHEGIARGEFSPCDAESTAMVIVSCIEGVMLTTLMLPLAVDRLTQLETAAKLMLKGLE